MSGKVSFLTGQQNISQHLQQIYSYIYTPRGGGDLERTLV